MFTTSDKHPNPTHNPQSTHTHTQRIMQQTTCRLQSRGGPLFRSRFSTKTKRYILTPAQEEHTRASTKTKRYHPQPLSQSLSIHSSCLCSHRCTRAAARSLTHHHLWHYRHYSPISPAMVDTHGGPCHQQSPAGTLLIPPPCHLRRRFVLEPTQTSTADHRH